MRSLPTNRRRACKEDGEENCKKEEKARNFSTSSWLEKRKHAGGSHRYETQEHRTVYVLEDKLRQEGFNTGKWNDQ